MAGTKRHLDGNESKPIKKTKTQGLSETQKPFKAGKPSKAGKFVLPSPDESSVTSDANVSTSSGEEGHLKVSWNGDLPEQKRNSISNSKTGVTTSAQKGEGIPNGTSSREAHMKQKVLAQERKAAKPNADSIARAKKIWERLRRKSHVPKDERTELVAELFEIITGRVKDFVFKHDSVRVIQTAVKYGKLEQRRQIARELKGEYRGLAESRYAKFLIAKLVVGDDEIRDLIIPEFYGHVKKLIRHPEAAWIMDDIYRSIATPDQKSRLLREWYGHEFVIFQSSAGATPTAELRQILQDSPEKRSPIMQHLKEMTNQLVQKKTTGFTMLHDALLQYFINCAPGSAEATELIETLKDDEDGDCLKNLAFTKSGSRLVCLALAQSSSKDRRTILRFFKGVIKMLASDSNGHCILLTAFDVIDDTVMTAKAILPELLCKDLDEEARQNELVLQVSHLVARIPLLYIFSTSPPKWLLPDQDISILREVHDIRRTSSKKDPEIRRQELIKVLSQPLIDLIAQQTEALVSTSFGCQFICEVMFGATGEKAVALKSLASMAKDQPELVATPHAGRMLKSLVQGGRFDRESKEVQVTEPPLGFNGILYSECRHEIVSWASGPNSFVVVAMLELAHMEERATLVEALREQAPALERASQGPEKGDKKGNAGARILLERINLS